MKMLFYVLHLLYAPAVTRVVESWSDLESNSHLTEASCFTKTKYIIPILVIASTFKEFS